MGLQVDPKELKKRQFFLEGNIPKAVLSVCSPMALFQLKTKDNPVNRIRNTVLIRSVGDKATDQMQLTV